MGLMILRFDDLQVTPVACPNKNVVTKPHECRITDHVSGHTFDLNPLHNKTSDIKITTNDKTFKVNICKNGLISRCGDQNTKLVSVCEDNDPRSLVAICSIVDLSIVDLVCDAMDLVVTQHLVCPLEFIVFTEITLVCLFEIRFLLFRATGLP